MTAMEGATAAEPEADEFVTPERTEPSVTFRIPAAEAYTTVGKVPGADASLPARVADLVTRAAENVTEPVMSTEDLDALIAEIT